MTVHQNKAAIYARLSMQGETEESIERQIALGIEYAKAHALEYVLYVEPRGARSGRYEAKRPKWKELKRDIAAGLIGNVIIGELARAHRNVQQQLAFVDWVIKLGVGFVSLRENIDPTTAAGKLMLTMLAAANEWYSNDISERKKRQYAARDKNIYASSVCPYGLTRTGSYPGIVWTPTDDFPAIVLIAELHIGGYGAPAIASELNRRGIRWLNRQAERSVVNHNTIRHVLDHFERYKPFLDAELYAALVARREAQRMPQRKLARRKHEPAVLTALLYCAQCGGRLHPLVEVRQKKRGERTYRTYRHRNPGCALGSFTRRRPFYEKQVFDALAKYSDMPEDEKRSLAHQNTEPSTGQPLDSKLRREKLAERLQGFEEMRADKEISKERFLEVKQQIEAELDELFVERPRQARTFDENYEFIDKTCRQVQAFLENINAIDQRRTNLFLRTIIHRIRVDADGPIQIEYVNELRQEPLTQEIQP